MAEASDEELDRLLKEDGIVLESTPVPVTVPGGLATIQQLMGLTEEEIMADPLTAIKESLGLMGISSGLIDAFTSGSLAAQISSLTMDYLSSDAKRGTRDEIKLWLGGLVTLILDTLEDDDAMSEFLVDLDIIRDQVNLALTMVLNLAPTETINVAIDRATVRIRAAITPPST